MFSPRPGGGSPGIRQMHRGLRGRIVPLTSLNNRKSRRCQQTKIKKKRFTRRTALGALYRRHGQCPLTGLMRPCQRQGRIRPRSDLDLLRDGKRIVDFDAEIADGAFEFRMPQQQLHRSQVAGKSAPLSSAATSECHRPSYRDRLARLSDGRCERTAVSRGAAGCGGGSGRGTDRSMAGDCQANQGSPLGFAQ